MKKIILILSVFIISCEKENVQPQQVQPKLHPTSLICQTVVLLVTIQLLTIARTKQKIESGVLNTDKLSQ